METYHAQAASHVGGIRANDGCPVRILIVDDSRDLRQLLGSILTRYGYQTIQAADGEQATAIALADPPDLILLDVMMPRKNGWQVCTEFKADPRLAETPIIFLSARSKAADRVTGLELGAADYINKPFNQAEVLARVKTHVQISSLTRALRSMNSELIKRQLELENDLDAARDIQSSLLPHSRSIAEPWVKIDWQYQPCDSVGGDVFNVFWLDREHLAAYMVDVSGHGVPAAMVTVAVSRSLSADSGCSLDRSQQGQARIASPSEVLRKLDLEYPMERFGKFLTVVYLILNCRTRKLRFSSAGHPPPLLIHADGSSESLSHGGTVIGLGAAMPFDEGEIQLKRRDRVFLYTDGIVERENHKQEAFGHARMAKELAAGRGDNLLAACERMTDKLNLFAHGAAATDDVTLCGLELQSAMKE